MRSSPDELRELSASASLGLERRGIVEGDRVCLCAPNSVELIAVVDACLRSKIAPVLISSMATERELNEMARDVRSQVTLFDDDLRELAGTTGTRELMAFPSCRPMNFTSGTSGRPKAVWSGWFDAESAQAWISDEQASWNISAADVHLVCGPLNHSAPLRFALMTMWAGGSLVVPSKFDPATVVDILPSVTTTFMAPTHLQRLMEHVHGGAIDHDLRLLAHAGAACPDRVRLWAHETFGRDVVTEFYGSSEGQFTMCSADEWDAHPGTVGRARPGRAMRVDSDGRLWSQAPDFARFEYWGDTDKTAQTWDGDWFTVGDYGRVDEHGYVYLEGRKGDLIITGGVNVYPAEIERVLSNVPGIDLVVAFGLPDEKWGQRVCVAVVGSVTEDAVFNFALDALSGPKRPKSIFVVDALPLTHSGKIDRSHVPALFA